MRASKRPGRILVSTAALVLALSGAALQAQEDPFGERWPEGEGRELTGAWCGGCHSLNLVRQQGQTREGWDELLVWMTEKQNMPPLEGERRSLVLDYLAANFGIGGDGSGARVEEDERLAPLSPVQGVARPPLEIRPAGDSG